MIKTDKGKRRKLSHEILGLIGISALLALILFLTLSRVASIIAEKYVFNNDVIMSEFDWIALDQKIFFGSALAAVILFTALFLSMLGERLAYIRKLTEGIDALGKGQEDHVISLEGNNELTTLAEAINDMSVARKALRQREQTLAQEKEQFIRTLSHDIRTPLTALLAYSELLSADEVAAQEQKAYHRLIHQKALQIRDLTDILLDGGEGNPEFFADARLLFAQLVEEFAETLEDRFAVHARLADGPSFSGTFDVAQLRRIFDNLSSNVSKYADAAQPVCLTVAVEGGALVIRQSNATAPRAVEGDSYKLGISSIRRIAQRHAGRVDVTRDGERFGITVILSEF